MKITFTSLVNSSIFPESFKNLNSNNTIEFSDSCRLAVVYAPNGVGKTSFARTLREGNKTNPRITYSCSPATNFIVISDQNGRDIIEGNAGDFFIGPDIAKADAIFAELDSMYSAICNDYANYLKEKKITTKDSWIIHYLEKVNSQFASFTNGISNSRDRGRKDKYDRVYHIISSLTAAEENPGIDKRKYDFFTQHASDVISDLMKLFDKASGKMLVPVPGIKKYEANEAAISILHRFADETTCVVCDTKNIDSTALLRKKEECNREIYSKLDSEAKKLLEDIVKVITDDPFEIKKHVYKVLETGEMPVLSELRSELDFYAREFAREVTNWFVSNFSGRTSKEIDDCGCLTYIRLFDEYNKLVSSDPALEDEEQLFLKEVISKSMGKDFRLEWQDGPHGKALRLSLDGNELLNQRRSDLCLSSGEQNFISIVFELLRARQNTNSVIVLDDPISSFDSIYKNKIAFVILDVFRKGKENGNYGILLTHNVDLLRLLNAQMRGAYYLYIFSKMNGAMHGFIHVNELETSMITDLSVITKFFRDKLEMSDISDEIMFLISMIPFIRGMANITGNINVYNDLSKVMHGSQSEFADISDCYKQIFNGCGYSPSMSCKLNSKEIISRCSNWNWNQEILCSPKLRLLDHTLRHTMGYLYLRIKTEEVICRKFNIHATSPDVKNKWLLFGKLLSMMIDAGKKKYPAEEKNLNTWKIQMMAMKTLVNEFNHFEGNLSIFQPAIDISDETLERERRSIEEILGYMESLT